VLVAGAFGVVFETKKNGRVEMLPILMVSKVISLQCRGGTRRELFVNSLFGVLMLSVWFYYLGNR
jgi:hypothetical protein